MIRAYDKVYLEKARTALGRMLDFAVYDLQYDIADFFHLFLSQGVADRFEKGDFSASTLSLYYKKLQKSIIIKDLRTHSNTIPVLKKNIKTITTLYPELACEFFEILNEKLFKFMYQT